MRRFEVIEDRNNAEDHCEHWTVVYCCLNCGGALLRQCEYCGKEFEFGEHEIGDMCKCDNPEWAERDPDTSASF